MGSKVSGSVWAGRVISWLAGGMLVFSAVGKFVGGPQLEEGLAHLGLPMEMATPLAVLELAVAVVYLVPKTAVLGGILFAGYMGGAICTHWRVGDPVVAQILLGSFAWLGLFLRESRLTALLPVRAG